MTEIKLNAIDFTLNSSFVAAPLLCWWVVTLACLKAYQCRSGDCGEYIGDQRNLIYMLTTHIHANIYKHTHLKHIRISVRALASFLFTIRKSEVGQVVVSRELADRANGNEATHLPNRQPSASLGNLSTGSTYIGLVANSLALPALQSLQDA